ncbi:hypothetical protein PR048_026002 [Dryococelus australis]|uniref:Uncharacterized protein n=1 Tax=Dryococelus australis TaxID=614101 RepID=A0ABQ9GK40_9NEOP|nr:hypothetical protein PR048_026002 [Dryococelus australis]
MVGAVQVQKLAPMSRTTNGYRGLESRRGRRVVRKKQRRNERAGKRENPRENPPTSGIARYDSRTRKSGNRAGPTSVKSNKYSSQPSSALQLSISSKEINRDDGLLLITSHLKRRIRRFISAQHISAFKDGAEQAADCLRRLAIKTGAPVTPTLALRFDSVLETHVMLLSAHVRHVQVTSRKCAGPRWLSGRWGVILPRPRQLPDGHPFGRPPFRRHSRNGPGLRDSHESARATRRHRTPTQLTSLSAGPSWHPTVEWPRPRTRRLPSPSLPGIKLPLLDTQAFVSRRTRDWSSAPTERLDFSPPNKTNRVQSLAGSLPDFRMWKSWKRASCESNPLCRCRATSPLERKQLNDGGTAGRRECLQIRLPACQLPLPGALQVVLPLYFTWVGRAKPPISSSTVTFAAPSSPGPTLPPHHSLPHVLPSLIQQLQALIFMLKPLYPTIHEDASRT